MAKMKVVQVPTAGGNFQIVEREISQPGRLSLAVVQKVHPVKLELDCTQRAKFRP